MIIVISVLIEGGCMSDLFVDDGDSVAKDVNLSKQ